MPDWTVTLTVPEPAGTTAWTRLSLVIEIDVDGVLPKSTWRWPAAPEKFCPMTVTIAPSAPLVALSPVTIGVRLTTSKSLNVRLSRPTLLLRMSLSFQVRSKPSPLVTE